MKHRTPSQYPLVRAISERELPLSNNVADMAAWRGRGRETDDVRRARIRARKKLREPWAYVERAVNVKSSTDVLTSHPRP